MAHVFKLVVFRLPRIYPFLFAFSPCMFGRYINAKVFKPVHDLKCVLVVHDDGLISCVMCLADYEFGFCDIDGESTTLAKV